jgi:hypothetical protein
MKRLQLLSITLVLALMANANIYYVSPSGDNSDGLSWSGAYQSIRTALNAASAGDELWVAQGTYIIEEASSQLIYKNGVNVYGGFAGTETAREQRSTDPGLTVVKHAASVETAFRLLNNTANLATPTLYDGFTFDGNEVSLGVRLAGNATLNNAVVKNCVVTNGSGAGVFLSSATDIPVTLSNTTVINNRLKVSNENTAHLGGAGVYIANGANLALVEGCNISNNTIEGISSAGTLIAMGAGVFLFEGTIRSSTLDANVVMNSVNATYSNNLFTGAAICIVPQNTSVPAKNVMIEGCTITNSESRSRGGAIIIDPRWSGQYHGNYTISKSVITNNRSIGNVGGAILSTAANAQTEGGWTLNIHNTVMANNSSMNGGGAIFLNVGGTFNMVNSTIVNNWTSNFGGGGIFMQGSGSHTISGKIQNSLLWGNVSPNRAAGEVQLKTNFQAISIENTAYQAYDPTYNQLENATLINNFAVSEDNTGVNGPAFAEPSEAAGFDATGALTANWQLTSASVAIDMGQNLLADDLLGVARPKGTASDLGAYEFNPGISTSTIMNTENQLTIFVANGSLVVNNTGKAVMIKVYSVTGVELISTIAKEGINTLQLEQQGIYIVRSAGQTQKVLW